MCGIVGYIGPKQATEILIDGLSKLEYRGYDSAGIALFTQGELKVEKTAGRLNNLVEKLKISPMEGTVGIGHTRWATHGRPSDRNSHPHTDCTGDFVVVHNGIIENYLEIKEELLQSGHQFVSETDTEVVAHLLESCYTGDFDQAVRKVLARIKGSYALVFLSKFHPDRLICARQDNPLVIGLGEGENFIASDIPAIIKHTRRTYILNDGEVAWVEASGVTVTDREGQIVTKKVLEVQWNAEAAEKDGYDHFMIKEIFEQPKAVKDTLSGRLSPEKEVVFKELDWTDEEIRNFRKIVIVACGTAYHAGLLAKTWLEGMARIPVEVDIASEFRYRRPLIDEHTLLLVISQSGETSDTLAALREGKRLGAHTLAITNTVGSSVARDSDKVLYTWAGPEIAVASTKAYTTQAVLLFLVTLYISRRLGKIDSAQEALLVREMEKVPELVKEVLNQDEACRVFAKKYGFVEHTFFIGRSLDYAAALEGALKLKEISYIHAEAYAAGELKHGTLALIEEGTPVIALVTQTEVMEKTISNIQEVRARDAIVLGIGPADREEWKHHADHKIELPVCNSLISPILLAMPLQLIAYYAAVTRGCDVDKPRNLAKSVTVE